MNKTTLITVSLIGLLVISGVAAASFTLNLERSNPTVLSPATENTPLLELDIEDEVPSGTEDFRFGDVYNNYDEVQSVTIDLSDADRIEFNDGSQTQTIDVQPGTSEEIRVTTTGPTRTCNETDNRETNSYGYESQSATFTVFPVDDSVEVCRPGGGGSDPDPDPDPGEDQIDLVYDRAVGGSGQHDVTWATDPEVEGGTVELLINDVVEETGLDQSGDERIRADSGDTVTVRLLDTDGNEISSSSITIP